VSFPVSARRLAVAAALCLGLLQSARMALGQNLKQHGGYWRAMAYINDAAANARDASQDLQSPGPPRQRVASAYYWAVAFRPSADVELVKLPRALLAWDRIRDDPAERQRVLGTLDTVDWFVGHMNLLWRAPDLMQELNARFEVVHFEFDAPTFEGLAPVCVLRRRGPAPERTFFELGAAGPLPAARPGATRFAGPDGEPWIELGGVDVETGLADDELCWVTFHWRALRAELPQLAVTRELADADGRELVVGYRGFSPAYGALPTDGWPAGRWIRESYPAIVPTSALAFGGAYARGQRSPVRVSVGVSARDASGGPLALHPLDADGAPVAGPAADDGAPAFRVRDGRFWDRQGRPVVAGFWLAIPPEARVPDDGRPLGARR
jgi:hypothetical protein